MVTQSFDRTGILIVRVWMESGTRKGFRARITKTLDWTTDEQSVAAAGTPDDVYAAVRSWVEEFAGADWR